MRDMPACFDSRAQYEGWRKFALIAKEVVSICSDCTPRYEQLMKDEGRCDRTAAYGRFVVGRKDRPALLPTEGEVRAAMSDEDTVRKLVWEEE